MANISVVPSSVSKALELVTIVNGEPRVSSLVIAEHIGVSHHAVLQNLDKYSKELNELGSLAFQMRMGNHGGVPVRYALLNEQQVTFLVTLSRNTDKVVSFKLALTRAFFEAREELKKRRGQSQIQLPDFTNPAEAARAWAEQFEQKLLAEKERDEAIRTKAEIGTRREATAMATASREKRRADALAEQLGEGKRFKTVKAIANRLKQYFILKPTLYQQVGKALTSLSHLYSAEIRQVESTEYGSVKAYDWRVIDAFFVEVESRPHYLEKFRINKQKEVA